MRRHDFRGAKCTKRNLDKCEGVCKTYDDLQYVFASLLNESEDVAFFEMNVVLEGLELEGKFHSDFIIHKKDGGLAIRECVHRDKLTRPLTCKLLDASRAYWKVIKSKGFDVELNQEKEDIIDELTGVLMFPFNDIEILDKFSSVSYQWEVCPTEEDMVDWNDLEEE